MSPPYSSTGYNAFTLNPNSINSIHIIDGAITAADIGDLGITGADIANNTIGLIKLDASLNTLINAIGVIVPDSINSSHIVDGSILGTDISNNTITNSNIADLTISQNKFSQVFLDRINTIESSIGYIPPNSVNSSHIVNGSILTDDICNNAITTDKLAPNSVNSSHIINGSILGTDISNNTIGAFNIINQTITATQIADETITASQIMNETITKFKIAPNAITNEKLASGAVLAINIGSGVVNSSHIETGSILGEDISNNTITKLQIADNAITDAKLANDAVINSKIAVDAVTTDKILDNAIITQKINNLAVTNGKIGDNAVNEIKLATNAVTTTKIADLNVTEGKIGGLAVTQSKIGPKAVGTGKIDDLAVTEGKLSTAVQTKLNAVGTIGANSINSSHIIDGSILTIDICNNAITTGKIADFSITNSKLDDNSIDSRNIIAGSILGTDIANTQIGVNHLTGLAYLDLTTAQAPSSIDGSHIVNGVIVNDHIYPLTITGAKIANTTITYDKLNSNITSLITNSNISRNYIFQTGTQSNVTIPVDLVNNEFVDVHVTFRFVTTFAPNNRIWCLFYNASSLIYNFKWYDGEFIVNQTGNPWLRQYFGQNSYNGMFAYDMEASNYYRATNLRIRVYRGDINTPVTDPRLYNVEGECQWGLTGYGPARATITGAIEYRPTHIYLYVPTGCTFIAKYYVTNYK